MKSEKDILKKALKEIRRLKERKLNTDEPVAIIGMACHFPGNVKNEDEFWSFLEDRKDGIISVQESRWKDYESVEKDKYLQKAGFLQEPIDGFDCRLFRTSPVEAEHTDPQQRLFLKTCWEALENSGYAPDSIRGSKTGVYAGIFSTEYSNAVHEYGKITGKPEGIDILGNSFSFLTGRVSYYFGLHGPSIAMDTACSSSLVAIDRACSDLKNDACEMAIAGGVNIMYSPENTKLISGLNILSEDCKIRSFDNYANGTVRGEGCGVVVLKKLSRAVKDNDNIYAVISGSGVNQDGPSSGLTAPYGPAQVQLLKDTWGRCAVDPDKIDYIEAHGTGTKLGDPIELESINKCIGTKRERHIYVGTVKSNIGHLEAAAGVAGLIKTVLMLKNRKIPGRLHFTEPNEQFDWAASKIKIPEKTISWESTEERTAAVNSFGLSGTNAHIIVKEYNQEKAALPDLSKWPFKFSSDRMNGLIKQITQFAAFLEDFNGDLGELSFSQNTSKASLKNSAVIWGESKEALKSRILNLINGKKDSGVNLQEEAKRVVFMFTGQGSQHEKMLLELYRENNIFKYWMDRCESLYKAQTGNSMLEIIENGGSSLNETRYTQPALFSVEYSLARLWTEIGIEPEFVLGHSIGEYAAACLAEVFSLEDAMKLVIARGELMFEIQTPGKMAAIFTEREAVAGRIVNSKAVSIAASNSPYQTIISGDAKQVEELSEEYREKGIKVSYLKVSHAFHSPLMNPMLDKFGEIAKQVKYKNPKYRFISGLTGKVAEKEITSWQYWVEHVTGEVKFSRTIQEIETPEQYIYLEVGPKPILGTFVSEILNNSSNIIATAYPDKNASQQLLETSAALYLSGCFIDWKKAYGNKNYRRVRVPNYVFSEQRLMIPPVSVTRVFVPQVEKSRESVEKEAEFEFVRTEIKNLDDAVTFIKNELHNELKLESNAVDNDENLLVYGISSVMVMRLAAKWSKEFKVSLSVSAFMRECSVSRWAEVLFDAIRKSSKKKEEESAEFEVRADKSCEQFLLNQIQYAYLVGRGNEMELGNAGCYACFEINYPGLNIEHFKSAVYALVKRHDMLRCIISKEGTQRIYEKVEIPFEIYELSDNIDAEKLMRKVESEILLQVLPLEKPLYDIRAVEYKKGEWIVYFAIDFMIADALSLSIIWRDLFSLYSGIKLKPLELTYRDYLNYERKQSYSSEYDKARAYWLNKIADFPQAPLLPLKTAKNAAGTFTRHSYWMEPKIWKKFEGIAAKHKLTPSAALLALYSEILSSWGGGDRFAVMLTVFRRENVHREINDIIGDFTRLVLLDINRSDLSVGENARNIQNMMQEDIENNAYSALDFVKELKKADPSIPRLYPVVFTSAVGMEEDSSNSFAGFTECRASSTPQVWIDHQVFREKGGITVSWDALDDIFFPGSIDAMFEKYVELINAAIYDEEFWEGKLSDLRTESQRKIQAEANMTDREYQMLPLHENIFRQAQKAPEAIAIVCGGVQYTYAQLAHMADRVSEALQMHQCRRGGKIAVQWKKSFEQIAIILGILQNGCCYIPLPYNQPVSRTIEIIEKAEADFIFMEKDTNTDIDRLRLGLKELEGCSGTFKKEAAAMEDLAYVIFTSGSTGVPKGVSITHAEAMNTILDVNARYSVTEKDCGIGLSSISFDLSVFDIFGILNAGGKLVLPTEEERMDPAAWKRLIETNKVTFWNSVPAMLELYADYMLTNCKMSRQNIRQVILSGDWIPLSLPDKISEIFDKAALTSMGGATECSIWSNYFDVDNVSAAWRSIPYGKPLANQQFHILDCFGRPCPQWVRGKLHIAGNGLAEGYLNDKELTEKAFIYHSELHKRLYDTGDYGRYMSDGNIEFLGRIDEQVKINGYRVEIKEIQRALRHCGLQEDAAIVVIGNNMENKKIVAFIKKNACTRSGGEYKKLLEGYLPKYMIPEKILLLDNYPMSSNGKLDKKKLQEIAQKHCSTKGELSGSEDTVLSAIREVLNLPDLKPENSFAGMGVSSVDIIRLANQLESKYDKRPTVGEMVAYGSVSELLDFYRGLGEEFQKTAAIADGKNETLSKKYCNMAQGQPVVAAGNGRTDIIPPVLNSMKTYEIINKNNSGIELSEEEIAEMKEIVDKCKAEDIFLWVEEKKLKYKAPEGKPDENKKQLLRENKSRLIKYLQYQEQLKEQEQPAFPVTPIQLAYILGRSEDYELGNINAQYYVEFETDNLDIKRFESSINYVISRNDMFYTLVYANGSQQVMSHKPYYSVEAESIISFDKFIEVREKWKNHRYELGSWPMFHIQVSRPEAEKYIIHFSYDCILMDGWSSHIFLHTIFEAYSGKTIVFPDFTFRDYILSEEKWNKVKGYGVYDRKYWEDKARILPPAPKLPIAQDLSNISRPHFKRLKYKLNEKETKLLNTRIKQSGSTASAVICTAYMKTLSYWSQQEELTVNVTLFNRLPIHPDVVKIIGDFTNIALIPYKADKKDIFSKELETVKAELWGAVEHRTYNGIRLLNQLAAGNIGKAVMPVVFTSLLFGENSNVSLDMLPDNVHEIYSISQTPQVVLDHQIYGENGELVFIWDYVEEAFDTEVIKDMFSSYIGLVRNLVKIENWDETVVVKTDDKIRC